MPDRTARLHALAAKHEAAALSPDDFAAGAVLLLEISEEKGIGPAHSLLWSFPRDFRNGLRSALRERAPDSLLLGGDGGG